MAGRGQEEVPHSQSANSPGHVHSILAAAFVPKCRMKDVCKVIVSSKQTEC